MYIVPIKRSISLAGLALSLGLAACLPAFETSPYDASKPQGLANLLFSLVENIGSSASSNIVSGILTDDAGAAIAGADVTFTALDTAADFSGTNAFGAAAASGTVRKTRTDGKGR